MITLWEGLKKYINDMYFKNYNHHVFTIYRFTIELERRGFNISGTIGQYINTLTKAGYLKKLDNGLYTISSPIPSTLSLSNARKEAKGEYHDLYDNIDPFSDIYSKLTLRNKKNNLKRKAKKLKENNFLRCGDFLSEKDFEI